MNKSPYGVNSGEKKGWSFIYGEIPPQKKQNFKSVWSLCLFWLQLKYCPRFCVDVFLISNDKTKVLMGPREQRPAMRYVWVPGGGMKLFEEITDCVNRHIQREMKLPQKVTEERIIQLKTWAHQFADSNVYAFLPFNFIQAKWVVSYLERKGKVLNRLPCHTPALCVMIVLNEDEQKIADGTVGGNSGELKGLHWVELSQITSDTHDAYITSNRKLIDDQLSE